MKSFVTLTLIYEGNLKRKQETVEIISFCTRDSVLIAFTLQKLTDIIQIFKFQSSNVSSYILIEGQTRIENNSFPGKYCNNFAEDMLLTPDKLFLLSLGYPAIQKIATIQQLIEYSLHSASKVQPQYYYVNSNYGAKVDNNDERSELQMQSFSIEQSMKKSLASSSILAISKHGVSVVLHDMKDKTHGCEQTSNQGYASEITKTCPYMYGLEKVLHHYQNITNAVCYITLMMSIIMFLCTDFYYLKGFVALSVEWLPWPVQEARCHLTKHNYPLEEKVISTILTCYVEYCCAGDITASNASYFSYLRVQEYFTDKYLVSVLEYEVYTFLQDRQITFNAIQIPTVLYWPYHSHPLYVCTVLPSCTPPILEMCDPLKSSDQVFLNLLIDSLQSCKPVSSCHDPSNSISIQVTVENLTTPSHRKSSITQLIFKFQIITQVSFKRPAKDLCLFYCLYDTEGKNLIDTFVKDKKYKMFHCK